jgi:hypothetical protein
MFKIFSKIRDRNILKRSNFGRYHGWYVEHQDKVIAALAYLSSEHLTSTYTITFIDSEYEEILKDASKWYSLGLKFRNKHYNQYVTPFIAGRGMVMSGVTWTIDLKYEYIDTIK